MPELTIERACEILNEAKFQACGYWNIQGSYGEPVVVRSAMPRAISLTKAIAIAIAQGIADVNQSSMR